MNVTRTNATQSLRIAQRCIFAFLFRLFKFFFAIGLVQLLLLRLLCRALFITGKKFFLVENASDVKPISNKATIKQRTGRLVQRSLSQLLKTIYYSNYNDLFYSNFNSNYQYQKLTR